MSIRKLIQSLKQVDGSALSVIIMSIPIALFFVFKDPKALFATPFKSSIGWAALGAFAAAALSFSFYPVLHDIPRSQARARRAGALLTLSGISLAVSLLLTLLGTQLPNFFESSNTVIFILYSAIVLISCLVSYSLALYGFGDLLNASYRLVIESSKSENGDERPSENALLASPSSQVEVTNEIEPTVQCTTGESTPR